MKLQPTTGAPPQQQTTPEQPPAPPAPEPPEGKALRAAKDYVPKLGGVVLYCLGTHDGHYGRINGARVHPAIITRCGLDDDVNLQVMPDMAAPFFVSGIIRGAPGTPRRWFTRPEFDALPESERSKLS